MLSLPSEILLQIVTFIESECDINSFARASKATNSLFRSYLYKRNARESDGTALTWAARHGEPQTALASIEAGSSRSEEALNLAIGYGHESIAELVLKNCSIDLSKMDSSDRTPLSRAASGGCTQLIRLMLELDATILNAPDDELGRPALGVACTYGREHVVEQLLSYPDIEVDLADDQGWTPLCLAAEKGHVGIMNLLLRTEKVNVNGVSEEETTPLFLAAEQGHVAAVKLLMSLPETDINIPDSYGETPLLVAARHRHTDVVSCLLEDTRILVNKKDASGDTALAMAASNGHQRIVQLLLDSPATDLYSTNSGRRMPVEVAADGGYNSIAWLILDAMKLKDNGVSATASTNRAPDADIMDDLDPQDCDMDEDTKSMPSEEQGQQSPVSDVGAFKPPRNLSRLDRQPLAWAADDGDIALVKSILSSGDVDINARDSMGFTALAIAASRGFHDVVAVILEAEAVDVNIPSGFDQSPLALSCEAGYASIVQLLLQRTDLDVNSEDDSGKTAFATACLNGHKSVVKLLLERSDVDIYQLDNGKHTALSLTCMEGQESIILDLVQAFNARGDGIKWRDGSNMNPIARAAFHGHTKVVSLLLKHTKISVNTKARYRKTALLIATERGHIDVVNLLLQHPSTNINHKDGNGRSALCLAIENRHDHIAKALIDCERVDINAMTTTNWSPLALALFRGREDVFNHLLQRADVVSRDSFHNFELIRRNRRRATNGGAERRSFVEVLV
ncbi:ankyrin repeats (3 copies) domain-containing protein [Pochonia chlamydosporia 170]|uniref:Ankyrin repeats (3 copies) domain-containing protein n=1 Tax=Pochonia chlamydosporia 170 TaxID=1380566 RepID=A0A179FQ12_METCM|nr:ankyrin repeats (3 copies) domain-containing protein [Pochonia chlamydosporia 170]OAQ67715.1 ankyrin repeats (3 copies) domain-containing protein [Pochonia chlamydosporia 170]